MYEINYQFKVNQRVASLATGELGTVLSQTEVESPTEFMQYDAAYVVQYDDRTKGKALESDLMTAES